MPEYTTILPPNTQRAVSMAQPTSARALSEAKHRHRISINHYPMSGERKVIEAKHVTSLRNPPYEKLRSHTEMTQRKVLHRYVPPQTTTVSTQLEQSDRNEQGYTPRRSNTPQSRQSNTPRVYLATGELLQPPSRRGEVYSSHRAFSAAKTRHYTPVHARENTRQQIVCLPNNLPGAASYVQGSGRPSHQPSFTSYTSAPVEESLNNVRRVESSNSARVSARSSSEVPMQRSERTNVRYESDRRSPSQGTNSHRTSPSQQAGLLPPQRPSTQRHGMTQHYLSYAKENNTQRFGRRIYTTLPKFQSTIC